MAKESRRGDARWQVIERTLETGDPSDIDACLRDLRLRYRVEEEPAVKESEIFFDTFDDRLFSRGLGCSRAGARVRLFSIRARPM